MDIDRLDVAFHRLAQVKGSTVYALGPRNQSNMKRRMNMTGFGEPQVQIETHMYKDAHSLDVSSILESRTVMTKNHVTWSEPHYGFSLCSFSVIECIHLLSWMYYQQHHPKKWCYQGSEHEKKRGKELFRRSLKYGLAGNRTSVTTHSPFINERRLVWENRYTVTKEPK